MVKVPFQSSVLKRARLKKTPHPKSKWCFPYKGAGEMQAGVPMDKRENSRASVVWQTARRVEQRQRSRDWRGRQGEVKTLRAERWRGRCGERSGLQRGPGSGAEPGGSSCCGSRCSARRRSARRRPGRAAWRLHPRGALLLCLELRRLPEPPDSAPPTSSPAPPRPPCAPPPSAARGLASDKLL